MKYLQPILNFFGNIFKIPLIRHIIAGILIFYIGEKKGQIKALYNEITHLRVVVDKPKIKVENQIQNVKVKDGASLSFSPSTDVRQNNIQTDSIPVLNDLEIEIKALEAELEGLKSKGKRKGKQRRLSKKINTLKKSLAPP